MLVVARGKKKRGRGIGVGFKRKCLLSSFRTECGCISDNSIELQAAGSHAEK
jgi:hypothetical protein